MNDFLKDTTFYVDYEENKLYTFLEELSSAFIKGDYYDIPKDPLKGFDLLYNFVNENYAILPEHVSSQLLDVLYEFCTENECLKPQINKLTNLKDFDQEEDVEENKIDISKQPKKEKKQRKPRKKNKMKSFFKKIISFLK